MRTHVVILVIDTDESEFPPDEWDWPSLIDTPLPVTVSGCRRLPCGEDPKPFLDATDAYLHAIDIAYPREDSR